MMKNTLLLLLWHVYLTQARLTRVSEMVANDLTADMGVQIPTSLIGIEQGSKTDVPGEPLTPEDFRNGKDADIINHPLDSGEDPIMFAEKYEGDILLTQDDAAALMANVALQDEPPRNAIIESNKKWPNGAIPYVISAKYSVNERATIAKALAAFHQNTCLRFVPRSNDPDYIFITKGAGCSSAVGRVGGEQQVSLGTGCVYFGIVIHELMHAAGFWHEQSRADRDDHVTIVYNNIQPGMEYNFQKYTWDIIQSLGVPYDTGSVMHYGSTAFAIDRTKPTIIPHNGDTIGQRNGFSASDKKKLNLLYQCESGGSTSVTPVPVITTTAPTEGDCIDSNVHCGYWAGIKECEKNPSWMNANCKKSCKQCGKCQNDNVHCDAWSTSGECQNSPAYMHKHCKKACGLCHSGEASASCVDDNKFCPDWAKSGECRVNPDYMMQRCRKSCKVC